MELGLLCTDEDDNEELGEVYGPLSWQGCGNDPRWIQEADVAWNYERMQFQGHIFVVQWAAGKKWPLHIDVSEKEEKEGRRSWISWWGQEGKRIKLIDSTM